jgi:hypothetical protein
MPSLVQGRYKPAELRPVRRVSRPERHVPIAIPVPMIHQVTEAEPRGLRVAWRVLRMGVVVGSLTAAWHIGMVIGQL